MTCKICERSFKNILALGVHQSRSEACYDEEAIKERRRAREARYRKKLGGRKVSAEYFREYRKRRKEQGRALIKKGPRKRGDRSKEYSKYNEKRREEYRKKHGDLLPLPQLYEELRSGKTVSWWTDELNMDIAQERQLAIFEGRDPDEAEKEYRARETRWHYIQGNVPSYMT